MGDNFSREPIAQSLIGKMESNISPWLSLLNHDRHHLEGNNFGQKEEERTQNSTQDSQLNLPRKWFAFFPCVCCVLCLT